jgi:hypothetical protein
MDEGTVSERETTPKPTPTPTPTPPSVRIVSQTHPIRVLVANAKGGCGKPP